MTRTTTLALLIGFSAALLAPIAQAQPPETLIKTENGVIVFIVNGQEQARIDATGLHVRAGIGYGDSLTDYGTAGFDAHARNGSASDAQ